METRIPSTESTPRPSLLGAIHYQLGEQRRPYREAENFGEVVTTHNIPDLPDLMGLGHFHVSERDILSLGIESARATMAASGLDGSDIDVVFFCSTNYNHVNGDGSEYVYRIASALNLTRAYPVGITLNNCTALLSAIKIAEHMIRGSNYKNILIITADKVYDESERCTHYGIFSDSAASCLLSTELEEGFEILSTDFLSDYTLLAADDGLSDDRLYKCVNDSLLSAQAVTQKKINKVFTSNIFIPITNVKESRIGFRNDQLYLNNVKQKGHCFSADAVINLSDFLASEPVDTGDCFVLSSDAQGLRVSILLKYRDAGSRRTSQRCRRGAGAVAGPDPLFTGCLQGHER